MIIFVPIILILILILIFLYISNKRKKDIFFMLNNEVGEKPKNFNKDFNINFFKKYYESRKKTEKDIKDIDELTWNDLDMDNVFKRTNYTNTTLGETYLYYKYKKISYNINEWKFTEKLINTLLQNNSLRNNIKFNLLKVDKLYDDKIIDFIYNPTFNKINGYYKYPLLSIALILSIISMFINLNIGIVLTIGIICINILFYQSSKVYLEDNFTVMVYLLKNIKLCKNLCKIKDKDFNAFRKELEIALSKFKNLKKIELYSLTISDGNNNMFSDLNLFADYIKMFFMIDIIAYQNITNILEKNKDYLYLIYDLVAQLDFAQSISLYRKSLDEYVNPEFTEESVMELQNLYHPLVENPIKNSITIDNNIIFTGSNASGKSTFIKAVALNCIMSQSLNTALCSKYKGRFSKVITSMAIRDDILLGDSYFIAEIKSIKRLIDSLDGNIPVLAFIDEILKGTNTIERISASVAILNFFRRTNSRLLIATHDIELTQIIKSGYDNYHFRETVTDNDVIFDYKLRFGPSTTRNAIKLLETMNFNSDIINDSNNIYDLFIKTKKWPKV